MYVDDKYSELKLNVNSNKTPTNDMINVNHKSTYKQKKQIMKLQVI